MGLNGWRNFVGELKRKYSSWKILVRWEDNIKWVSNMMGA